MATICKYSHLKDTRFCHGSILVVHPVEWNTDLDFDPFKA